MGVPAGVGRGAGRADGATEGVGQLLDELEAVGVAETPATGGDDRGLGHLGAAAGLLLDDVDDLGALRAVVEGHVEVGDLGRAAAGLLGDEGVRLDAEDLDAGPPT
jgi:hypothetical protein